MLHKKINMRSESGFGLIEVMVASAILALIVGAVTIFMQQSSDNLVYRSAKIEQQRIYHAIKSDLQNFDKIKYSGTKGFGGNVLLNRCLQINNAKALDCTSTSAANQVGFQLWTRQGLADIQKSGPSNAPMTYSLNGVRDCVPGTAHCPFWKVETYFWATCPDGAKTCDQASNIHTRYIVRPIKGDFRGVPIAALPPAADFAANKTKYAISHNVSKGEMKVVGNQSCPTGALMSGLNENGIIKCECRGGFEQVGKTIPIVCKELATACKAGERIKGRNKDGSVKCVPQQKICKVVGFAKESATCPVGGWLEKIDLGYCRPAKKNKKGTKRGIACDKNQGTCCYFDEM